MLVLAECADFMNFRYLVEAVTMLCSISMQAHQEQVAAKERIDTVCRMYEEAVAAENVSSMFYCWLVYLLLAGVHTLG